MSTRGLNMLLGIAALTLGGLLYILLRQESYIAVALEDCLFVTELQLLFSVCNCDFLKYYFPDFLWGFSLYCGLFAIHMPSANGSVICGAAVFLCGCLWEAGQYWGIIGGTSDLIDVVMYLTAGLAGILLNLKERVK